MQNSSSSSVVFVCWWPFLTIFEFSSLQVLANALTLTLSQVFKTGIISMKDKSPGFIVDIRDNI